MNSRVESSKAGGKKVTVAKILVLLHRSFFILVLICGFAWTSWSKGAFVTFVSLAPIYKQLRIWNLESIGILSRAEDAQMGVWQDGRRS